MSPTATSPRRKRKFIIADTPGHIQYTRNMVTGASTANLALILVDARNGIVEQSRRHAFIASLLRVPHLVLCVNKMDLVDYDEDGLRRRSRTSSAQFATKLDIGDLTFIPVSALHGDNVVHPQRATCPGTTAPSLLHHLEEVHIAQRPQPASTCGSRCSTSSGRSPDRRSCTTTAATPARSRAACSSPATRSLVLPSGLHVDDRGDRHGRRAGRRGVRADVGDDPARRTTSTSPAAT